MKKKLLVSILALLFIAVIFTGCAGSGKSTSVDVYEDSSGIAADQAAPNYVSRPEEGANDSGYYNDTDKNGSDLITTSVQNADSNEKIIYYAYASVETLKFEDTLKAVDSLIQKYKAFIESSSVTGNDYSSQYYGTASYRNANFVIRVPKESYEQMSGEMSILGNVTSYTTSAQNITSQFVDTQSRLEAYNIEETRLLAMLEKAETVADMITIETRLSEVRYNIESLTSVLNNWQHQVDYSTINLSIYEVKELTPEVEIPRTLGDEISDALSRSFKAMVKFMRGLLVVAIAALPVLVVPAIIVVAVLLIVRARSRRRQRLIEAARQNKADSQSNSNNSST